MYYEYGHISGDGTELVISHTVSEYQSREPFSGGGSIEIFCVSLGANDALHFVRFLFFCINDCYQNLCRLGTRINDRYADTDKGGEVEKASRSYESP